MPKTDGLPPPRHSAIGIAFGDRGEPCFRLLVPERMQQRRGLIERMLLFATGDCEVCVADHGLLRHRPWMSVLGVGRSPRRTHHAQCNQDDPTCTEHTHLPTATRTAPVAISARIILSWLRASAGFVDAGRPGMTVRETSLSAYGTPACRVRRRPRSCRRRRTRRRGFSAPADFRA